MASPGSLPRLLGISGSLRRQSFSTAVLTTLLDMLKEEAVTGTAPIGDLPLYNADLDGDSPPPSVRAQKDQIDEADALLFVTPEYNYSVPGVLKNAIDWASRPGYQSVLKGKPAVIITVSGGMVGGARCHGHLKQILLATLTDVLPWPEVLVGSAASRIDDGRLTDQTTLKLCLDPVRVMLARVSNV